MNENLIFKGGDYKLVDAKIPKNPQFSKPLIEIEKLLRQVGQTNACRFADSVHEVLELLKTNPQEAMNRLVSNEYWGGSGSFFDLVLYPIKDRRVSDDFEHYNRNYRKLLLDILLNLKMEGYSRNDFDFLKKYLEEHSG